MRPAVFIVGGVAIVLAGGAGLMLNSVLKEPPPPAVTAAPSVPPKPRTIGVLVAATALEVGRTVDGTALEWQEWPEGSVSREQGIPIAASEAERAEVVRAFDATVLRVGMVKGEPFTDDKVLKPGGGSLLALVLAPGMRSMTIQVDPITGAGGMAQPGDRVDLMLTTDLLDEAAGKVDAVTGHARPKVATETILQDLRLISSDRRLNPNTAQDAPIASNVTLEVTPEQAEIIATATRMGRFSLSVRPLRRGDDPERRGPVVTTDVEVTPRLQAARRGLQPEEMNPKENPFALVVPTAAQQPPPDVPAARKVETVTIYRADRSQVLQIENGKLVPQGLPTAASPGTGATAPNGVPSAGLPSDATRSAITGQ